MQVVVDGYNCRYIWCLCIHLLELGHAGHYPKKSRVAKHVDAETIKDCGRDLECLLQETDVVESKASLRSFIRRIELARENPKVHYILPIPPDGKMRESLGALPMVTSGGEGGSQTHTPSQHMILSHSRLPIPTLPQ